MRILDEKQKLIINQESCILNDLRVTLAQFNAHADDLNNLRDSIQQLAELFLLVVVGEFNAGKSAFINALLGESLLEEGVTPTTTKINILKFGEQREVKALSETQQLISLPTPLLSDISIVDTPGTNAIIRSHEEITTQFIPRSDLVLFITSVDRPFTESERAFLEKIRSWGKKVVFIINKIDILQNQAELTQIEDYVSQNVFNFIETSPEIFSISSRQALQAKQDQPELLESSQFKALEEFIYQTLDEKSRLQLKLLNPLGVGLHLTNHYMGIATQRMDLLTEDFSMISNVESQLEIYQEDMKRDFNYRMADIENVLLEMEQRGVEFFDETFRLARVIDLIRKDRIQRGFEDKVIADVPIQIEQKVQLLIDWLVDCDFQQWYSVYDHISEQIRTHKERIMGDIGPGKFHYEREHLMDSVGRQAQHVIDSYDKESEAKEIARAAQEAVAASAVLEVGAVGLGTLVAVLASTAAADITGILLASLIAALGIFIIPARRKAAKTELHEKVIALRKDLVSTLRVQFGREIQRSLEKIQNIISPYTRFVRAEKGKLMETATGLEKIKNELHRIKVEIENI